MQQETEQALERTLNALATWVWRQAEERVAASQPGFYDEEREHDVDLQSTWQELRRLQGEVAEWRQNRATADGAHRDAINILLSNYRTLADEVDELTQKQNKPISASEVVVQFPGPHSPESFFALSGPRRYETVQYAIERLSAEPNQREQTVTLPNDTEAEELLHLIDDKLAEVATKVDDQEERLNSVENLWRRPTDEDLMGLRELCDAIAADQGQDRKRIEALERSKAVPGGKCPNCGCNV